MAGRDGVPRCTRLHRALSIGEVDYRYAYPGESTDLRSFGGRGRACRASGRRTALFCSTHAGERGSGSMQSAGAHDGGMRTSKVGTVLYSERIVRRWRASLCGRWVGGLAQRSGLGGGQLQAARKPHGEHGIVTNEMR